ncbi:glycerol-3-phosphate responsive antiterminator [Thermohalobacter berrensis]|nr:glycerol-3-phosphate responsive antiterminator [Thermohalobacter berrensis]
MNKNFYSMVQNNPIIAAVNSLDKLDKAIKSPCEIIFLLTGNIMNLKGIVEKVKNSDMSIYVHLDLMGGLSKDVSAIKYIGSNIKPDGIITTKSNLVKYAKEQGIFTIQRLFILDSLSLETGVESIISTKPDAIEILPGIMPKITSLVHEKTRIPIITGGLIKEKEDVINSLNAGAIGISTSTEKVWYV